MPNDLKIRGPSFQIARRDVLALVESGRLTRAALEARLDPDDLELLHETPRANAWYPLATYDRFLRRAPRVRRQRRPRTTSCAARTRARRS